MTPAGGSGRFLLSCAEKHPHWDFVGVDVDHRCAQMTAINLGLRNLYGYAVWGNSLTLENHRAYRTGFNIHGGVIREEPIELCPVVSDASPSREFEPIIQDSPVRPIQDDPENATMWEATRSLLIRVEKLLQ